MGKDTAISWTHHTFNPWWGCEKVSPACAHCYAQTFADRFPASRGLWGKSSARRFQSDKYWNQPLNWDRKAAVTGERHRVFCASMADVFEDREDLDLPRLRLFDLICKTPNLDWLLLTKRPERIMEILKRMSNSSSPSRNVNGVLLATSWRFGTDPANIWLGTTVENQEMADKRIPELLKIPAKVRFLSCEPLLGPVDLALPSYAPPMPSLAGTIHRRPDWVICGGESGASARPMHPNWARYLRNQCAAANVPFHFKQHGEWLALDMTEKNDPVRLIKAEQRYVSYDGQIHSVNSAPCSSYLVSRVGTARAGRLLDGVLHDAFPVINP